MNAHEAVRRREGREPSETEEGAVTGSFAPVYPPRPSLQETTRRKEIIDGLRSPETANDNHFAANDHGAETHRDHTHAEAHSHAERHDTIIHTEEAGDSGGHGGGHGDGSGSGGSSGGGHEASHDHGHHGGHHENPLVKWGVKQPLAIFGFLLALAWQGLKRWSEMAGKGGGGGGHGGGGGGGGGHH